MERFLLSSLLKWKDKNDRKPLILKGARQVGKTYLLRDFGSRYFSQCHYVNFEKDISLRALFQKDLNPARIVKELELHFQKNIKESADLLIFDEIQECPPAITSLKYFCEEMPGLALVAAGSLLGLELAPVSYPVGKVEFLHLTPLHFFEFLEACARHRELELIRNFDPAFPFSETTHGHLWELFKNYLIVGGMPEAVRTFIEQGQQENYHTYQQVREKQQALITTYLADMAKHAGKQNSMHIERLWKNIPEQLAQESDATTDRFRFRDVIPGVKAYSRLAGVIDWLEKANLIFKLKITAKAQRPLMAKENRFKLYLFDVGLLGVLSGLTPNDIHQMDFGSYKGFVAENFVAQECVAWGFSGLHAWRENTSEVEFLMETKEGHLLPLEVKAGCKTRSKSLSIFCEKYSPSRAWLLNAKPPEPIQQGPIQRYPLYFLSGLLEKEEIKERF